MGSALLRLAAGKPEVLVVAAVSRSRGLAAGAHLNFFPADELQVCPAFDVAVDFSLPDALAPLLSACLTRNAALVSGTTGYSADQFRGLEAAARQIPIVWAANFSLGVVVLEDLVQRAAAALKHWDVRIEETHHAHKKDAPSGTALTLARATGRVGASQPQIDSIRRDEVVGDHLVSFSGPGETVELRHHAESRDIFASGALEAACVIAGKRPGLYRMADLMFPGA